jgi:hypothetical protein
MWVSLLDVGDFYYELAVQCIDICLRTRRSHGGLIRLEELTTRLRLQRGSNGKEIAKQDVALAIQKVGVLGSGFKLIALGEGKQLVASVPVELNKDHITVLAMAQQTAYVTSAMIATKLDWANERIDAVLVRRRRRRNTIVGFLVPSLKCLSHPAVLLFVVSLHFCLSQSLMLKTGMTWIDSRAKGGKQYWFPSLFPQNA